MEVPDVRRRLRAAIETGRKTARERRARIDEASRDYETFLDSRAIPVFRVFAAALTSERFRFNVFTPAGSVRLASESAADDFIELWLDPSADPPVVVGRISRGRGRRNVTTERPLKKDAPVAALTEEDVLEFLLSEIVPFVER